MAERKRSELIEMFLKEGVITQVQLNKAKTGIHTNCEVYSLVSAGYISGMKVVALIMQNCKIPYVELTACDIPKEILKLVPEEYCSLNCCLPVEKTGDNFTVAMVDPLDEQVKEELAGMTKTVIRPVLCSNRDYLDTVKTVWIDIRKEEAENAEEKSRAGAAKS